MKVYLASGWFNKDQMKACKEAEESISLMNEKNFFPRLMNLGTDGVDWQKIYDANIFHLEECDTVVCVTEGKDMGALIEAGYAIKAGKRIIYYTPGIDKPNLMLAFSGQIARTIQELEQCLSDESVTFVPKDFE